MKKNGKVAVASIIALIISVIALGSYAILFEGFNVYILWIVTSIISLFFPLFSKYIRKKNGKRGTWIEIVALAIGSFDFYCFFFAATTLNIYISYAIIAIVCIIYATSFKSTPSESIEDMYTPTKFTDTFAKNELSEPAEDKTTSTIKSKYCKHCGSAIDTKTKKCTDCGKQYFHPKIAVPLIILSVALALSISLNIEQYLTNNSHVTALESKEEECEAQEKLINSLKYEISELEELEDDALSFERICTSLTQGNSNIGYASEDFRADKGIIVLSESDSAEKLRLTTDYRDGCSVTIDASSGAAQVSFDEDNWHGSTTLTVEPQYEGVCVVTFSNDVNLDTFKVLIIVTESENSYPFQKGFDPDIYWQ